MFLLSVTIALDLYCCRLVLHLFTAALPPPYLALPTSSQSSPAPTLPRPPWDAKALLPTAPYPLPTTAAPSKGHGPSHFFLSLSRTRPSLPMAPRKKLGGQPSAEDIAAQKALDNVRRLAPEIFAKETPPKGEQQCPDHKSSKNRHK